MCRVRTRSSPRRTSGDARGLYRDGAFSYSDAGRAGAAAREVRGTDRHMKGNLRRRTPPELYQSGQILKSAEARQAMFSGAADDVMHRTRAVARPRGPAHPAGVRPPVVPGPEHLRRRGVCRIPDPSGHPAAGLGLPVGPSALRSGVRLTARRRPVAMSASA